MSFSYERSTKWTKHCGLGLALGFWAGIETLRDWNKPQDNTTPIGDCLTGFIDWWREANFGSGDDYVPTMLIDRRYRFRDAIILGLRGDRRGSAIGGITPAMKMNQYLMAA